MVLERDTPNPTDRALTCQQRPHESQLGEEARAFAEEVLRRLERQYVERSPEDWLRFWSDGERFEAAAGPKNLIEALGAFKAFAQGGARPDPM